MFCYHGHVRICYVKDYHSHRAKKGGKRLNKPSITVLSQLKTVIQKA